MSTKAAEVFLKEEGPQSVTLSLYVQPGASRSEWSGLYGDYLKLRIQAPPVDGQANKEVIRFLAHFFTLSKSEVELLKGQTGRIKTVRLALSKTEALLQLQNFLDDRHE